MNIIKGDILGTLYDWFFHYILSFLDEPSKVTEYNMLSQLWTAKILLSICYKTHQILRIKSIYQIFRWNSDIIKCLRIKTYCSSIYVKYISQKIYSLIVNSNLSYIG